ncbi:hypothetical protein LTR97_005565 [Elasticomyces elasticus]|uniref:tRNA-splicing endonuclease subunit Sen15 domain-containing protein n=1 Tax=Elasticomyces elasticus TaxID=574655 RepID=A0AAN7VTE3_9PEZI|nr:hypothetical protein LTR97_005565 [Elasticomyces elasticus]
MSTSTTQRNSSSSTPEDPTLSGLHQFIQDNRPPRDATHEAHAHKLALQVAHNLRFQHGWTEIRLHYHSSRQQATAHSLPRPVISGLPPQRLYMHPDEQIEVLQRQREQGKAGWPEVAPEREWVVPSQLQESWTLRRFGDVFDALSAVPAEKEGGRLHFANAIQLDGDEGLEITGNGSGSGAGSPSNGTPEREGTVTSNGNGHAPNKWRTGQPKRVLLATLDDDSTVVYYIVHDGIVKPRQN